MCAGAGPGRLDYFAKLSVSNGLCQTLIVEPGSQLVRSHGHRSGRALAIRVVRGRVILVIRAGGLAALLAGCRLVTPAGIEGPGPNGVGSPRTTAAVPARLSTRLGRRSRPAFGSEVRRRDERATRYGQPWLHGASRGNHQRPPWDHKTADDQAVPGYRLVVGTCVDPVTFRLSDDHSWSKAYHWVFARPRNTWSAA